MLVSTMKPQPAVEFWGTWGTLPDIGARAVDGDRIAHIDLGLPAAAWINRRGLTRNSVAAQRGLQNPDVVDVPPSELRPPDHTRGVVGRRIDDALRRCCSACAAMLSLTAIGPGALPAPAAAG
jgi:hypothetical protein